MPARDSKVFARSFNILARFWLFLARVLDFLARFERILAGYPKKSAEALKIVTEETRFFTTGPFLPPGGSSGP